MNSDNLNAFSLVSRLFGNLFYRQPTDSILTDVFVWLQQQGLSHIWALATDSQSEQALKNLQVKIDLSLLDQEYSTLFLGHKAKVSPLISSYGINVTEFVQFRAIRAMQPLENPDHFGLLLLTASWLEDNVSSSEAQKELFERFLLPCASQFLLQVEKHATLPFYLSLALLTREILAAMADELDEVDNG